MLEKFYPTVVYNNQTVSLNLFKIYNNKTYLLYSEDVYFGDITKISKFNQFSKIASSLKKEFLIIEDKFDQTFRNIYCMIEPKNYYSIARNFNYDLKDEEVLTIDEIKKIFSKMKKYEQKEENYQVVSFCPQQVYADGKKVQKIINEKIDKLNIVGEAIFIDNETYQSINNILDELNRNVLDYIVSNYSLKYLPILENKSGVIEIESEMINFSYRNKEIHNNFRIDRGMGHIFEKLFHKVSENYPEEDAYKITKYMQEHQLIDHQSINYEIIPRANINDIIDQYNAIFISYLNSIFQKLSNQGIEFKKLHLISYGYQADILVEQFNKYLKIDTKKLKVTKIGDIQYPISKIYWGIKNYNETTLY